MAQLDYLGTWEDSWAILQAILEPGDARLFPDLRYEYPQPFSFASLDESSKEILNGNRSLFIWFGMMSRWPPSMWRIEAGPNGGRYAVDARRGGPLLHLTLPACYRYGVEGLPEHAFDSGPGLHLAPGTLSVQSRYQNPETEVWEAPSDGVNAGYKEIARRMKTQLVRHRFHMPIWIGVNALREIELNKATIHGFGRD